jgi:hypothetical protein
MLKKKFSDELWMLIGWTIVTMLATTIGHIAETKGTSWGGFANFLATPWAVILSGVWLGICSFSLANAMTTRFQKSEGGKVISILFGIWLVAVALFLITKLDEALFCWSNARLFLWFCVVLGVAISGITIYSREPGQILPLCFWRENTEPEEVEEGEAWDKPFDEEEF